VTVIDAGPLLGNWHEEGRPPGRPAAAGAGTTPEAAAGALAYAGDELATQVHEQLRARWPAGYREAASQGAGQDAVVPASRLRTVMPQPYPERVDGYRAQLRAGGDIGPSLAVRWNGHLVLVDGTHRAAARVLEGQRAIPATVLNLP
jgi:hypothetical protein